MVSPRPALVRVVIRAVLIGTILQVPAVTSAYETDIHFTFTMFLAELAGFSQTEAFEIAKYDQGVDDDPATQPMQDISSTGTQRRAAYHFVNQARVTELRARAAECAVSGQPPRSHRMGTFFHALEDLYSHRSFGPALGHLTAGHAADKPWYNPGGMVQMAEGKFNELLSLRLCVAMTGARRIQAEKRFAPAKALLEGWAQREYNLGTVSDDQGPERWAEFQKRLYAERFGVYTGYWAQYRDWKLAQDRNSWREQ